MNFLAHAYLSFGDPDLLTGNMISDFVKGKKQFDYPAKIRAGIQLHRAIDDFTDAHSATAKIKEIFRPHYRLYAGALTDVVYDYFLANDANEFASHTVLKAFTDDTYQLLESRSDFFPPAFRALFPYMKSHDWLFHYRTNEGILKSFGGVQRRAKYLSEINTAYALFLTEKEQISESYRLFFPEVKAFAAHTARQLLQD